MAKFGTATRPLLGTTGEKVATHEGGTGFVREPKAELYITAVSSLMENSTYESAGARESRLSKLTRNIAIEDPDWTLHFVSWLRREANLRSVAVVVACEAVKARLDAKIVDKPEESAVGINRRLIAAACLRADEPGEVLAYWQSRHGRNLPMPVKRGLGDAVRAVYNERAALRYDGGAGTVRLGDVIELSHPSPRDDKQSALFGWLLDRRHARRETPAEELGLLAMVSARTELNAMPIAQRHEFARKVLSADPTAEFQWNLALAGQWEWGKSWLGQDAEDRTFERVSEADQWKLFAEGGMGYMALLRNLRNFEEAKISADLRKHVIAVLSDPEEVRKSRQFPFRFLSAFDATKGGPWAKALGAGLQYSLSNVPSLDGNTLILADMSGSMFYGMSGRGSIKYADQAALFGSALALRAEAADLVQFGSGSEKVPLDKSKGVLDHMSKFPSLGGTQTMEALRTWFRPEHTRVVILTDEQAHYDTRGGSIDSLVPEDVPVYTWNVAGYRAAHSESGPNRHTFGGLTDSSWRLVPLIETGATQDWPWES